MVETLQKELGHASPNRLYQPSCLSICLYNNRRNRTLLRSEIVKPHTEARDRAVSHGMLKSPASAASGPLSKTLDAVDVLSMLVSVPPKGGI